MEFLLRVGSRLANRYVVLVALLVLLGAGFAYVSGLNAEQREELLYKVQELLPILMFLTLGVLLFSGYPVAFILGGLALLFGFLGFFLGSFKLVQFFNFVQNRFVVVELKVDMFQPAYTGRQLSTAGAAGMMRKRGENSWELRGGGGGGPQPRRQPPRTGPPHNPHAGLRERVPHIDAPRPQHEPPPLTPLNALSFHQAH